MNKFLKWAGIVLAVLVGLLAIGLGVIYFQTEARLNKVYDIPPESVAVPTDAASIARGKHIYQFRGCQACHGGTDEYDPLLLQSQADGSLPHNIEDMDRLQGNVYMDDPAVGQVVASNLTSGQGGVADKYTDETWVRAIRHGIRHDGTPLLFMPSTEFYYLSDEDLGAVIAYLKSVPPVDNTLPASQVSMTGRILMALVPAITFMPAEIIPHDAPRPVAPEAAVTPEYGEYLTQSCKVCHGLGMSGGKIPAMPSSWPPAPNLTWGNGSALPRWTESDFITAMRTGKRPQGQPINSTYMPWTSFRYMDDLELKAVWAYLQALPPKDYGNH